MKPRRQIQPFSVITAAYCYEVGTVLMERYSPERRALVFYTTMVMLAEYQHVNVLTPSKWQKCMAIAFYIAYKFECGELYTAIPYRTIWYAMCPSSVPEYQDYVNMELQFLSDIDYNIPHHYASIHEQLDPTYLQLITLSMCELNPFERTLPQLITIKDMLEMYASNLSTNHELKSQHKLHVKYINKFVQLFNKYNNSS